MIFNQKHFVLQKLMYVCQNIKLQVKFGRHVPSLHLAICSYIDNQMSIMILKGYMAFLKCTFLMIFHRISYCFFWFKLFSLVIGSVYSWDVRRYAKYCKIEGRRGQGYLGTQIPDISLIIQVTSNYPWVKQFIIATNNNKTTIFAH